MEPERVYAHPMVRADAGCVALRRGPIIYTFEGVDNGEDLQTLRFRGRRRLKRFRIRRICWKVSWRCA